MKDKSKCPSKVQTISAGKKTFVALVLLMMIPFFFATKSIMRTIAQERGSDEKIIKKESFKNELITFLSFESDGQRIEPDKKFVREVIGIEILQSDFKTPQTGRSFTYR